MKFILLFKRLVENKNACLDGEAYPVLRELILKGAIKPPVFASGRLNRMFNPVKGIRQQLKVFLV